jgi:hypothetical protein
MRDLDRASLSGFDLQADGRQRIANHRSWHGHEWVSLTRK